MKTLLIYLVLFLQYISMLKRVSGTDPCINYIPLPRLDQRLPSKQAATQGELICDRYLEETWYKAESAKMTETVPKLQGCSTTFPVYLSGPHPTTQNITEMTACKVGLWGPCTSRFSIRVKKCGESYVYYLLSTRTCSSAYCFEYTETDEAPNEKPTNVLVSYSDIYWKEKKDNNYTTIFNLPHLEYSCTFDIIPNKDYCYKILWLIGNKVVHEQGTENNITKGVSWVDDSYFPEDDYHLGITLLCSVGASYCGKSRVGIRVTSKDFFIGLQLQTKEPIIMEEQGKKKITFKSTVPFACSEFNGNIDYNCFAFIQSKNWIPGCTDQIRASPPSCEEKITGYTSTEYESFYKNKSWEEVLYHIDLVHATTNTYVQNRETVQYAVVLEVEGEENHLKLWKGKSDIPMIKVYVEKTKDKAKLKDSCCKATGDPHIKSFDGENFDDHGDGTRYLYVNRKFSQQVQVQNFACDPGNVGIRCICGVAVSAGRDVFFISVCNSKKLIDYINCEDNLLLVQKISEHEYEVIMQQKTNVKIYLFGNMINVVIHPSSSDLYNTQGLCGHLDDKYSINVILNKGISVPADEDLFDMIGREDFSPLTSPHTTVVLCTCNKETNKLTCKQSNIECNTRFQIRMLNMLCSVRSFKKRRRRYILKDDNLREKRQSESHLVDFNGTCKKY